MVEVVVTMTFSDRSSTPARHASLLNRGRELQVPHNNVVVVITPDEKECWRPQDKGEDHE